MLKYNLSYRKGKYSLEYFSWGIHHGYEKSLHYEPEI